MISLGAIPSLVREANRLDGIPPPIWWSEMPPEPWVLRVAEIVWPVLFVVTAGVWLAFQYRAHALVWAAPVRWLRYTPSWAVLWWFIPLANLGAPAQVISELLRGVRAGPGSTAERGSTPWLVVMWWPPFVFALVTATIGMQVRTMVATSLPFTYVDPGWIATADRVLVASSIGFALAAPSAIAIVVRVRRSIDAWPADRLEAPRRPDAGPRTGPSGARVIPRPPR
jgi:hypothetical protein